MPTEPIEATGNIVVDGSMVDPKTLIAALGYAGQRVGIGASRKMGWGRFTCETD